MPATRKVQSQESKKHARSKKNIAANLDKRKEPRTLLAILSFVGILTVILVAWWMIAGANMNIQSSMTKYLEDKYGKEFVVENIRREGQGIGVDGDVVGDATSKDNGIEFRITDGPEGSYSDTYLTKLWSKQEDPEFSHYLENISLRPIRYNAHVLAPLKYMSTLDHVPSLEEALKVNDGKEVTYGVVTIFKGEQVTDRDKANLQKLIEYVRSKNPMSYSVRYVINSQKEDKNWRCQYYGGETRKASRGDLTEEQYVNQCFVQTSGRE